MGTKGTAPYGTKSIGTTASAITDGTSGRGSIIVQNAHATNILYLGSDSSVTTSNGIKIGAGDSIEFTDYVGPIYGIASGASTDVRYMEVGG